MAERGNLYRFIRDQELLIIPETDPETFRIKGHRFEQLQDVEKLHDRIGIRAASELARQTRVNVGRALFKTYQNDAFGFGAHREERFEGRVDRYLKSFLILPDDYPAEVAATAPDTFCKTCPAIGTHCRVTGSSIYGTPANVDADEQSYMKRFLRFADENEIPLRTRREYFQSVTTLTPKRTTVYETTLGVVKSFVRQPTLNFSVLPG